MSDYFYCKNFKIKHHPEVFKVNTDAVLLAAWVDTLIPTNILEIGSGTGIIALCLADKYSETSPHITAIDIDKIATELSSENFKLSSFKHLKAIHCSLEDFVIKNKTKYDMIVSNPPFHTEDYFSTKAQNIKAKYTESLSFEALIASSAQMMNSKAELMIIAPHTQINTIESIALNNNLYCNKITEIYPKVSKLANRVLLKFTFLNLPKVISSLIIYNDDNTYTDAYKALTSRYYLKF